MAQPDRFEIRRPLALRHGNTIYVATLTGHYTITPKTAQILLLDPDGATRNVVLPEEESHDGWWYVVCNTGTAAADILTPRNDAAGLIGTIYAGAFGVYWCNGTTWYQVGAATIGASVAITDAANWYTTDTCQGVADEVAAAIGGTNSTTRAYTHNDVVADNETLYTSIEAIATYLWRIAQANAAGDGAVLVGVEDAATYWTGTTVETILAEIIANAIGGTNSATRAYSGAVVTEPVDNATLTAALGSEMLVRRLLLSNLLMDETSPPVTNGGGRGLVISGGVVAPQGAPDLTVIVPVSTQVNHLGRYTNSLGNAALGGFTIPAGGLQRIDAVCIDTTGTPVRRTGVEGAAPAAQPVLQAGDVPLAIITLTQGVDIAIAAGNITDCRQTVAPIDGTKVDMLTVRAPADTTIDAAGLLTVAFGMADITVRGFGGVADNLDTIAGLEDGQIAVLHCGNAGEPISVRDNAVGGGNIWTPGAATFILAALTDSALVVRHGAMYMVCPLRIGAGIPAGSLALADANILVGNGANHAAAVAMSSEGALANTGAFGARHATNLVIPLLGAWAVDGDGVETNGGGLVGDTPHLTNVAATFAKVCDASGAPDITDLATSHDDFAAYTNNFQVFPDVEGVGDYVAFGHSIPFCEIGLDMSAVVGVYAGDSCIWEYSQGGGAWAAIVVYFDNTDTGGGVNGTRPFQQDGAFTFSPAADWATDTIDGQLAYWIRSRVTAATITTAGVTNAEEHSIVTGDYPWIPPHNGTITGVTFNDAAAALHGTADVIVVMRDETTGANALLTFTQNLRRDRMVVNFPVTTASRLSFHVSQEDGVAEPQDVMLGIEFTYTA